MHFAQTISSRTNPESMYNLLYHFSNFSLLRQIAMAQSNILFSISCTGIQLIHS